MEVELRDFPPCKKQTPLGVVDKPLPQKKVFARMDAESDWKFVGYVGITEDGKPVGGFAPGVTGLEQEQVDAIGDVLGVSAGVAPPDPVQTTSTDERLEIDEE